MKTLLHSIELKD